MDDTSANITYTDFAETNNDLSPQYFNQTFQ
jgi:hypothetical protein